MTNTNVTSTATATPRRLPSAAGSWFETPTQKACTDYCRSPYGAVINALALAFRLGVQIEVK